MKIVWDGPYGWPKYEGDLPALPKHSGIYLQTVEYRRGYLIYAAGITRRDIAKRFAEHTRKYMSGGYNVLDIAKMGLNVRREIWHGWNRHPRALFEKKKRGILEAARKQLEGFRIFVADVDNKKRLLERLEAGIMNSLYQNQRFDKLPDEGMWCARRKSSEKPIRVTNSCSAILYGLPNCFEI